MSVNNNYNILKKEAARIVQIIDKKPNDEYKYVKDCFLFGIKQLNLQIHWDDPEISAFCVMEPIKQYIIMYNGDDIRETFPDYNSFVLRLIELHAHPELHSDTSSMGSGLECSLGPDLDEYW